MPEVAYHIIDEDARAAAEWFKSSVAQIRLEQLCQGLEVTLHRNTRRLGARDKYGTSIALSTHARVLLFFSHLL
jgi:hypothetical protein